MNSDERFRRMREAEDKIGELVARGWQIKRVIYDDEEGHDLHAQFVLAVDGQDERARVI